MKIKYQTVIITIMIAATTFWAAFSAHAGATTPQKAMDIKVFEASPSWAKLDLRLKDAWREAAGKGDNLKKIDCLLQATRPISSDDKVVLKNAGFNYRSIIGTIATGIVKAENLKTVADLGTVKVMELSVPLSIKKFRE